MRVELQQRGVALDLVLPVLHLLNLVEIVLETATGGPSSQLAVRTVEVELCHGRLIQTHNMAEQLPVVGALLVTEPLPADDLHHQLFELLTVAVGLRLRPPRLLRPQSKHRNRLVGFLAQALHVYVLSNEGLIRKMQLALGLPGKSDGASVSGRAVARSGIDIGSDERELLLVLSDDSHDHLSHVNADLYVQVLVLFGPPLEHLGLVEHLLRHPQQPLHLVPPHHLVLHLTLDLLYARGSHVGVPHRLYLLHCEAGAELVELPVEIVEDAHDVAALFLDDRVEVADVAKENGHAVLAVLPALLAALRKEVPHKLRHQNRPDIVCLVRLHLYLLAEDEILLRVEGAPVKHRHIHCPANAAQEYLEGKDGVGTADDR